MAGLISNNFYENAIISNALNAQTVNAATVDGPAIVEPWRTGRQLAVILVGGTLAAGSSGRFKASVRKRSDATWVALLDKNATQIEFPVLKLDDAGALENGALVGTLDLDYVDSDTYNAIRFSYTSEGAQNQTVAAAYVLYDLYARPGSQIDDLFGLQR